MALRSRSFSGRFKELPRKELPRTPAHRYLKPAAAGRGRDRWEAGGRTPAHTHVREACLAPAPPPLAFATETQAGVLSPTRRFPSPQPLSRKPRLRGEERGFKEIESTLQVPSRFSFSHNAFPGIAQIYSGQQCASAGIQGFGLQEFGALDPGLRRDDDNYSDLP
jgi:hypothetical protein